MKMMIAEGSKVFYIHGLYGSKNSMKFKNIQERFKESICLEWKFNEDIDIFLDNSFNTTKLEEGPITIVGSSIGGNFAWQLQQRLLEANIYCDLLLFNPLVELMHKYEDNFPQHLVSFLKPMNDFKQTKVIIGLNDEVINSHQSRAHFEIYDNNNPNQIELIIVEDDHRISNFNNLLQELAVEM